MVVCISVESVVISPLILLFFFYLFYLFSLFHFLLHLFDSSFFLLIWLFCWSVKKISYWIYWFLWRFFWCDLFKKSATGFIDFLKVFWCDLFKKSATGFIDFFEGFVCVCLLQFCSDLVFCYLLRFYLSCSFRSFNFDNRVSILDLFSLLWWAFIAINFPLDTALNVSQRLRYAVSLFLLVSKNIFQLSFYCLSSWHAEPVVQFPWSCTVLSLFMNSEFNFECTVVWETICYDFCSFVFADKWFTSNYVVNFRVSAMRCWEECMFCGFGVEISADVY